MVYRICIVACRFPFEKYACQLLIKKKVFPSIPLNVHKQNRFFRSADCCGINKIDRHLQIILHTPFEMNQRLLHFPLLLYGKIKAKENCG